MYRPERASQNQPIGMLRARVRRQPGGGRRRAHGVAVKTSAGCSKQGVATDRAKHFPGLGRGPAAITDVHRWSRLDTVTAPDDPYLRSYQAAINSGVPFVMVALATYTRIDPRHLAVFSSGWVMRLMLQASRCTSLA